MFKKLLFITVLIVGLMSCEPEGNDNMLIHGTWNGVSWEIAGIEQMGENSEMMFVFNEDSTYSAGTGAQMEKGVYLYKNERLYTTAEGKIEKMVGVTLPSSDTIIMNMNRVGTAETITLVKE
jgi:hypothetical protein